MLSVNKNFVMMLICVLTVLGVLLVVEPSVAPVTVPDNPEAAPEIVSVKINSNHQYYPPTYSTNPYTGETTLTSYARYYPNGTIEITIKNRPFTPYIDKDGHTINRYYTFFTRREEAYFSWKNQLSAGPWYAVYQSNTDYTVITTTYFPDIAPSPHIGIMYEDTVQSFRVQAVTGYFINNGDSQDPNAVYEGVGSDPVFFEVTIPVTSGTSPKPTTTTFVPFTSSPYATYPANSSQNTTNPPTNPPPQTPWTTYLLIIIATVCIITVPLVIIMYHNKHYQQKRKAKHHSNNHSNTQFAEFVR